MVVIVSNEKHQIPNIPNILMGFGSELGVFRSKSALRRRVTVDSGQFKGAGHDFGLRLAMGVLSFIVRIIFFSSRWWLRSL